jgi:hypothetical protein
MLPSEALGPEAALIWLALVRALGLVPSCPLVMDMLVHWLSDAGWAVAVAVSPIAMLPRMSPAATSGPDRVAMMRRVNGFAFMMVS